MRLIPEHRWVVDSETFIRSLWRTQIVGPNDVSPEDWQWAKQTLLQQQPSDCLHLPQETSSEQNEDQVDEAGLPPLAVLESLLATAPHGAIVAILRRSWRKDVVNGDILDEWVTLADGGRKATFVPVIPPTNTLPAMSYLPYSYPKVRGEGRGQGGRA